VYPFWNPQVYVATKTSN